MICHADGNYYTERIYNILVGIQSGTKVLDTFLNSIKDKESMYKSVVWWKCLTWLKVLFKQIQKFSLKNVLIDGTIASNLQTIKIIPLFVQSIIIHQCTVLKLNTVWMWFELQKNSHFELL